MPAAVIKWRFRDPFNNGETYTFEVSPKEMDSPYATRTLTTMSTSVGSRPLIFEGSKTPKEWVFSGTLFKKSQYDALKYWSDKTNYIEVRDHFMRTFHIVIRDWTPTPRRSVNHYWLHDWSMTAVVLRAVSPASVGDIW